MARSAKPVTLITGASSGIGAALAQRLAQRGDHVILVARRQRLLQELSEQITAAGGTSEIAVCDVTDADAVRACVGGVIERHDRIDRLILNAGGGSRIAAEKLTAREMRATVELNLFGVVNFVEAALPTLLNQGNGQIVAIGSLAGFRGLPSAAAYGAAKAALMNYIESLRVDLAPRGISVMLAAPGFVVTKDTKKQRAKPLSIGIERAVDILAASILARKSYVTFPWRLAWIGRLVRLLPAPFYDRLVRALDR